MMIGFFGICILLLFLKGGKNFEDIANRPLDDDEVIDDAEKKGDKNE